MIMASKKKVEVETPEVPATPEYVDGAVIFHKDRWDNDSGTNQLRAEQLPSLND